MCVPSTAAPAICSLQSGYVGCQDCGLLDMPTCLHRFLDGSRRTLLLLCHYPPLSVKLSQDTVHPNLPTPSLHLMAYAIDR
jgi:hypothetical protein